MNSMELGSGEGLVNQSFTGRIKSMSVKSKVAISVGIFLLIVGIILAITLPLTLPKAQAQKQAISNGDVAPASVPDFTPIIKSNVNLPPLNIDVTQSSYIYSVHEQCARPGVIALTFDDGPSEFTSQLLDNLKKYNVPATFFIVGSMIADHPGNVDRAYAEGHTIASHTYTHANLSALDAAGIANEMTENSNALMAAFGKDPIFMRPPYLEINTVVQTQLYATGFVPITINFDTNDWQNPNPAPAGTVHPTITAIQSIISDPDRMSKSYIVLMHDILQTTVDLSEQILQMVLSSGLTPVKMEDCLGITNSYR